ncbi:DUF3846 domain-containing protein [Amycolatopsis vastitatis]|uniref:DUF3846 domain-containing protein n=1 Tax=Amycolatopsis vastitatis TaxID=1905142 RepID=A0A229TEK6_9PSEU|nr:DUF3846 domain-containing protein [Amycolatopsis vastitatis]OXM69598.1 hypothetical protein CF165_08805 [Amycolatopsis vastitatis]
MTDLQALVVTPDGEIEEKYLPASTMDFLDALHATINCDTAEAVRLGPDGRRATMWVDVDARLPMANDYATALVFAFNGDVHQRYYGTAVFLGAPDRAGDDTSLPDEAAIFLRHVMFRIKRGNLSVRNFREGDF